MGSSPLPKFSLLSPKNDNSINYLYHKTRHSYIYVADSRSNGWIEWAEFFCGHSWVAWGKKGKKIRFKKNSHGQYRAFQLVISKKY